METSSLQLWPLSIVHDNANPDLDAAHRTGNQVLAYVSLVEIASDASYSSKVEADGLKAVKRNAVWNSRIMDVRDPRWRTFIIEELVQPLKAKGYDGLFLDTIDSAELLIAEDGNNADEVRQSCIQLLSEIREVFPDGHIILNRGFPLLDSAKDLVDGVMAESVFQSYNFSEKKYQAVTGAESSQLVKILQDAKLSGYEVYVLDYVEPNETQLAFDTAARIEGLGFHAFVSTPDLMGLSLSPIRQRPRQIMVFYGDSSNEAFLEFPFETTVYQAWQASLEWLGFELDYFNCSRSGMPEPLNPATYEGIIVDADAVFPEKYEVAVWRYLLASIDDGIKVFFLGDLPYIPDSIKPEVKRRLSLSGSLESIGFAKVPTIDLKYLERFSFELPIVPSPLDFYEIGAPEGADVWLRAVAQNKSGMTVTMDGVFITQWGGALLRPYEGKVDIFNTLLLYVDPIVFSRELFGPIDYPVPDVTTAMGRRIFYSHIDGDGMFHKSAVELGKRSGEVIEEKILQAYPLPVTVSVITAEAQGNVIGLDEPEPGAFLEMAKRIMTLPNVEMASHTYSHPFFWSEDDFQREYYDTQSLAVDDDYSLDTVDFEREIVHSVEYINDKIGNGDSCQLLLWSGNCRPPPEALAIADEANILNMNGGDTLISKRAPYRTLIAPKAVTWEGHMQVHAANQNENVYNNEFGDGLYGGYSNVIETFELTESPIRFKPVNVYYHFYSADRPDAFRALKKVMDWVMEQDLFPMTAVQYVKAVKDSISARIYFTIDGFLLQAGPNLQTWRYAADLGYPDLAKSSGIIGFNDFENQRYLITDGQAVVKCVLQGSPPSQLYLVSSTIPFEYFHQKGNRRFSFKGWGSGKVVFANLNQASKVTLEGQAVAVSSEDTQTEIIVEPGQVLEIFLKQETAE